MSADVHTGSPIRDPASDHAPPAAAPLADARRAIACALSALAAARGLDPGLADRLALARQHLEAASRDLGKVQR